ncbi:hypothetical protein D0B54_11590 [Solimonas sp. K1W22B-7]|uniref:MMPL family transporter n=1 Tax=Solimonas sp. K1W22B-7 TaxID=2303331 RepID=UPI000E334832|nr:MMPL family transporter [Solimonas sp. K1W22B-7]AXQ29293.1 hypothetical protein D0B54_11590 [Solimonas sp. K1W22B-7]
MSKTLPPSTWRALALGWLLIVAATALHQWRFWHSNGVDADVLALLPQDERQPAIGLATQRLAEQAARKIVVLLGAPDWPSAQRAAAVYLKSLETHGDRLRPALPDDRQLSAALEQYRPWRDRLLTPAQRRQLQDSNPAQLTGTALAQLYQPAAGPRLTSWQEDPLGLWPQWWLSRSDDTRARPRDGQLWLHADNRDWAVLPLNLQGSAFALNGEAVLDPVLAAAAAAAQAQVPGLRVLATGVPLFAEAAAVQASREMSVIGLGSLAAVLLLVWLSFRSLRPILLVGLSLVVGCAVALSVTALVFGRVHLLTLVFGASLVGVAEDYGIHYFASRRGRPAAERWQLLSSLLPGLLLAFATSALAYLALGLAPFPGLRQMALFSAVGLAAAFLTVLCWFPWLDRGEVRATGFAARIAGSLEHWPRLRAGRGLASAAGAALLFGLPGLLQLRSNDDIRQLQSAPAALVQAQREAATLLGLPSPAQFYLVSGSTAEEVLQREEQLKGRLDAAIAQGNIGGYRAVSDWLPSAKQQAADAALTARVETQLLLQAGAQIGEDLARPAFAPAALSQEAWLAGPASLGARDLWLGRIDGRNTSVVMLRGLSGVAALPQLAALAQDMEGVRWVDRAAEISTVMQRYRLMMGGLLLVGYLAVSAAIWRRFGAASWRVMLPTIIGTLLTLACLGWAGQALQLFNVLALILLLGIGVDYGIFLFEHEGDGDAWLSVCVGAASTLLSFGLLGLSTTPALRAFGLTLLIGITLVWLISPLFVSRETTR